MTTAIVDFRSILGGAAGVIALVSDRIYPAYAPQETSRPYIVVQRVRMSPTVSLNSDDGLDANTVQLDIFADTRASAEAVSAAVRTALLAAGGILEQESDDYDPQVRFHRITQQWFYWSN